MVADDPIEADNALKNDFNFDIAALPVIEADKVLKKDNDRVILAIEFSVALKILPTILSFEIEATLASTEERVLKNGRTTPRVDTPETLEERERK